jgi:flagellar basal-body rod protein FlgC
MSLTRVFDVAGSAMTAQSIRLNTTASNMANAQSAASSADEVYRARQPVFAAMHHQAVQGYNSEISDPNAQLAVEAGAGVEVLGIVESDAPLQKRYEPSHPLADEEGFVLYPNVNVVEEMANMISASRSFEMNVDVMDAAKSMVQQVLAIGQ